MLPLLYSGKTLGGGTSINGAVFTRGMKEQYDALSQLLTEEEAGLNWNFDSLFSYMKKVRKVLFRVVRIADSTPRLKVSLLLMNSSA